MCPTILHGFYLVPLRSAPHLGFSVTKWSKGGTWVICVTSRGRPCHSPTTQFLPVSSYKLGRISLRSGGCLICINKGVAQVMFSEALWSGSVHMMPVNLRRRLSMQYIINELILPPTNRSDSQISWPEGSRELMWVCLVHVLLQGTVDSCLWTLTWLELLCGLPSRWGKDIEMPLTLSSLKGRYNVFPCTFPSHYICTQEKKYMRRRFTNLNELRRRT